MHKFPGQVERASTEEEKSDPHFMPDYEFNHMLHDLKSLKEVKIM